jgi:hypothetical protein
MYSVGGSKGQPSGRSLSEGGSHHKNVHHDAVKIWARSYPRRLIDIRDILR